MKKLKIAIAGLGTVGSGVYEILHKNAKMLEARSETKFEIVAVTSRTKKDFVSPNIKFYENTLDIAKDPEVDVVVELIGGTTIAKELLELSIKNGKKFVTANKALIAEYGAQIADLVEQNNGWIGFEASVAGANPIIKNIKEGLVANEISEVYGILNGTCNFILTKMTKEGSDFLETLKEAQKLGYAEADPTFDIKGFDAAHKLSILAAICSSTKPQFKEMHIEGIDQITSHDIKLAGDLGYKIKLLGIYKDFGDSSQQSVYPSLVKKSQKIAQVDGPFNTVLVNGSNSSWNMSIGRGAGSLPTASAVVADLVDIANDHKNFLFGVKAKNLTNKKVKPIAQRVGQYFLNLKLDKSLAVKGNLAEEIFGSKVKITQAAFSDLESEILCGFLTNQCQESEIINILNNLDKALVKAAKFIRVENIDF